MALMAFFEKGEIFFFANLWIESGGELEKIICMVFWNIYMVSKKKYFFSSNTIFFFENFWYEFVTHYTDRKFGKFLFLGKFEFFQENDLKKRRKMLQNAKAPISVFFLYLFFWFYATCCVSCLNGFYHFWKLKKGDFFYMLFLYLFISNLKSKLSYILIFCSLLSKCKLKFYCNFQTCCRQLK